LKLLGEFYRYRVVDSGILFDTLYQLLGHGSGSTYRVGHSSNIHSLFLRNGLDVEHFWQELVRARERDANHEAVEVYGKDGLVKKASPGGNSDKSTEATEGESADGSSSSGVKDMTKAKATHVSVLMEQFATTVKKAFPGAWTPGQITHRCHPIDEVWDFFRVKLAVVLLDNVGSYFVKGDYRSVKKSKLYRFLLFLQRYILMKGAWTRQHVYGVSAQPQKNEAGESIDEIDRKMIGESISSKWALERAEITARALTGIPQNVENVVDDLFYELASISTEQAQEKGHRSEAHAQPMTGSKLILSIRDMTLEDVDSEILRVL
jgi:hypothetical protein